MIHSFTNYFHKLLIHFPNPSLTHTPNILKSAMSNFECSICIDSLEDPENINSIVATPCGHLFHEDCIKKWLRRCRRQAKLCPTCRAPVRETHLIKCYPEEDSGTDSDVEETPTQAPVAAPIAAISPPSPPQLTMAQLFPDHVAIFGSGDNGKAIPGGPISCAQLKFRHKVLISDFGKLHDLFQAREEELSLIMATKNSLVDQKIKLANQIKQNSDQIRILKSRRQY